MDHSVHPQNVWRDLESAKRKKKSRHHKLIKLLVRVRRRGIQGYVILFGFASNSRMRDFNVPLQSLFVHRDRKAM